VLTTHYLEEADALADRIVLMAGGRVLADDSPAGIKARADGKRLRARTTLAAAELASWPGVLRAEATDAGTEVVTREAEPVLRRWLAADPGLAELEVRPLSLEEAFVSLTHDRAAAGPLEKAA
jgi:ABC-2 type transport system ATP-binding protein